MPRAKAGSATPPYSLSAAVRALLGLAILIGCFLLGDFAKRRLGLIVPGSVLGLVLLLGLLGTGLVRLEWVESAAKGLLFVMPALFVPIYVTGANDRELWREWGWTIAGVLAVTVVLLWLFAGRLGQRFLRQHPEGDES